MDDFEPAGDVRPCPWCGEVQFLLMDFQGGGPPAAYQVHCDNCGARGPCVTGSRRGDHEGAKENARHNWNTAPRPTLATEF